MDEILILISQWGVIPLLIVVVYHLYKRNEELLKVIREKNEEIRKIEKENIGLLYKCLAALKKINKRNND